MASRTASICSALALIAASVVSISARADIGATLWTSADLARCDWNHDGVIDLADVATFAGDWEFGFGDFDRDGDSDDADLSAFIDCLLHAPASEFVPVLDLPLLRAQGMDY